MNWLLSLLKGLWPGRRRTTPAAAAPEPALPPEPEAPPPLDLAELEPSIPETPPEAIPPIPDEEAVDESRRAEDEETNAEDEAEEEWEAEDGDLLEPDPFITSGEPLIETLSGEEIAGRRADAMARALEGEHRIYLSDAAGPGSLAEALNLLLKQGRVIASFHDDDAEGPFIQYSAKAEPGPENHPSGDPGGAEASAA